LRQCDIDAIVATERAGCDVRYATLRFVGRPRICGGFCNDLCNGSRSKCDRATREPGLFLLYIHPKAAAFTYLAPVSKNIIIITVQGMLLYNINQPTAAATGLLFFTEIL
jgi:hypothetical protein